MLDVGKNTTATFSNLSGGNTYFFAISAYNTFGLEGPLSAEISFTPTQAPVVEKKGGNRSEDTGEVHSGQTAGSTKNSSVSSSTFDIDPVIAVGTVTGAPLVRFFDAISKEVIFQRFAYNSSFRGGVRVAIGDVNNDGYLDLITGAGPGAEPHIKVFSGQTGSQLAGRMGSFFAYSKNFRRGVNVTSGDVNGDGFDDIIVAPGLGGEPHVKVFSGRNGARLPGRIGSFFAYSKNFRGGVNVASGDVNGDGFDDIITGAGRGGGPHVRVFSGRNGARLPGRIGSFFAYSKNFRGGVNVASGDVNGDGFDDIITGAGRGGGPHVRVFSGETGRQLPAPVGSFFAYMKTFRGGISVASGDLNDDGFDDIVTGAGPGGGPHVRVFSGRNGRQLTGRMGSFYAYSRNFRGGVWVAAAH